MFSNLSVCLTIVRHKERYHTNAKTNFHVKSQGFMHLSSFDK